MNADKTDVWYCYRLILGRQPDADGWEHFQERIEKQPMSPEELGLGFITSEEFIAKHGPVFKQVDQGGITWFYNANDASIGRPLAEGKIHEPHISQLIIDALRPGDSFLDIGASIGIHAFLVAKHFAGSVHVAMIEPSPINCAAIRQSIEANKFHNCTWYPIAGWDAIEPVNFTCDPLMSRITTLVDSRIPIMIGLPLDVILKPEYRVVKLDVDGSEARIIRGMPKILERAEVLFFELNRAALKAYSPNTTPLNILTVLMDSGFKTIEIIEPTGPDGLYQDPVALVKKIASNPARSNYDLVLRKQKAPA